MTSKWLSPFGASAGDGSRPGRDRQSAVNATMLPIAIGQMISSIESLTTGSLFGRTALLRGTSARSVRAGTLLHTAARILDAPVTPKILATMSFGGAALLLAGHGHRRIQIAGCTVIGACNRLLEIRSPYGRDGADQMTATITQYRSLSALIPDDARSDDLFLRAVNFQAGLSYFVSGVSKLFGSSWVQGDALGEIVQTEAYGGGPAACFIRKHPRLGRLATWATPVWEASFPLIYLLPSRYGRTALAGVKTFHVAVASVMELPRFIWGFFGSHGAVQYVLDGRRLSDDHLERIVVGATVATALTAGIYATTQRAMDMDRRRGLKGTKLLDMGDGFIEYRWKRPTAVSSADEAPIVILEAGLGNSLDAWAWVESEVSPHAHVFSYHRGGYGQSTSHAKPESAVRALLQLADSRGPVIGVAHSIGVLAQAQYANVDLEGRLMAAVVVVDGTDPDLLSADRIDRRRVGAFLQAQAHTMFSAVTGIYLFAPNAVARQSRYEPDQQNGTLHFVFAPGNIYQATREYFALPTEQAIESLRSAPRRYLVASHENAQQQEALARKIGAEHLVLTESSHRSIIGYRPYALSVADVIREAIDASV